MTPRFGSSDPGQTLRDAGAAVDKLTRDLDNLREGFEAAGDWSEFPQERARAVMLGLVFANDAVRRLVAAAEEAAGNRHGVGLEVAFDVDGGGRLAVDPAGHPWIAHDAGTPSQRVTVQEAREWIAKVLASGRTLRPGPGRDVWLARAVEPEGDHEPESN